MQTELLDGKQVSVVEVSKSPVTGEAPVDKGVPVDTIDAMASTYSQDGTGVNVQIDKVQQQEDIATIEQGLETAEVPDLPQEQYAAASNKISAWGTKHLLKFIQNSKKPKKTFEVGNDAPIDSTKPLTPDEPELTPAEEVIKLGDAETLVGKSTADYNTEEIWQTNFSKLENEDDVNGLIASVSEQMQDEIMEARGGIIKDDEVIGLAEDLGTDPEFVSEFINSSKSQFLSPENILAARKVLNNSATYLHDLATLVSKGEADPKQQLAFKKQYAFHQQFMGQFMAKRANVGRALRAYGLPAGSGDAQADHIQEMLNKVHGGLDIEQAAKQIASAPNAKAVHGMVDAQDSLMRKLGNVFIENYVNSILSGIKTHIINTTGSAMMIGMRTLDTAVAARLGTHVDDMAMTVNRDEWKAGVFGMLQGTTDAFGVMWQTMKTAEPYGGVSKLENNGRAYISGEYLGIKGAAGTMVDGIGQVIRAPTERLMGGVDGFMKVIAERQSLAAVAYRKANAEAVANSWNQEQTLQRLNQLVEHPTEDMIDEAQAAALHVTFQTPLGTWGKQIQQALGNNPFTQFIAPFVKTPINLMKQGFLERTPLAYVTQQFQDDVAAGGARSQMARARVITGTSVAMAGGVAVLNGFVTGSGGSNYGVIQARMETGWRPYSFVFSDEYGKKAYVSYQRTEPLSYMLATMADLHETLQVAPMVGENEQKYAERVTGAMIAAISNASLDRSFMTGIESFMNLLSNPTPTGVNSYMRRTINSAVPFSGARRDITRLFDDTKKLTDGWQSEIQANIPYYSSSLPDRLDTLGLPIQYDAVMNPLPIVGEKNIAILDEAARLAIIVNKNPIALPSKLIEGIRLTSQQYHNYVKYSRNTEVNGEGWKKSIDRLIKSSGYAGASDDMKYELIKNVTSTFHELARAKLFAEDEELFMKTWERKLKQTADAQAKSTGRDSSSLYDVLKAQTQKAYDSAY